MFTGIIQATGKVISLSPQGAGKRLTIDRSTWKKPSVAFNHGDSICISGVCLTLIAFDQNTMSFDVVAETLEQSTIGSLTPGDSVNLEPSLTPTTPMGGHFVQGHIDGTGKITKINASPGEWRITITPPKNLMDFIVPKGSITLNGISLTIASASADTFDIALIPTTLDLTTLGQAKEGDAINIETDILSRTIVHHLKRMAGKALDHGLSLDTLRQAGF